MSLIDSIRSLCANGTLQRGIAGTHLIDSILSLCAKAIEEGSDNRLIVFINISKRVQLESELLNLGPIVKGASDMITKSAFAIISGPGWVAEVRLNPIVDPLKIWVISESAFGKLEFE